ncbi:MAG TPA: chemotaxis protein CheZ [Hydrogenophaga sp.]|jgi:chemotaxis protein CheZ|uniref:Protein phosphatase CheZ n=1 Tax=Hydrogenophaga aromaticivorans TaxID=2610898 RepID=A0A7Y8GSU6_9BURK|nr:MULTISPECIES: protein phosphatase CheZ [Hydrogenophaga]MBU4184173.1 protein phosphatase CheZ [Gammaproteobacteria bacterium]MBW8468997.1 protein phosphatase CheZ [Thiobacillus sp.]OGA75084.1 MAG: chemotaxis protein CheZ [Burkholderiales bacterium GWE1_65_30]OGA90877.1 MAG: chemotaxis protein CheZ [Burkholderiales bacterium GWF1_66_17]OGB14047.1 MAG: chemotaxis protein CheZ [Burkholderiales bacterium RIFCSPHIGHO2_02_FULL_66_10]
MSSDNVQDSQGSPEMFQQLGSITRQLHDALKELGYTDKLKGTVDQLPDAQSRLSYIARLTGEAADKVLNHVEGAKAEQAQITRRGRQLVDSISTVPGLSTAMPELLKWSNEVVQNSEKSDARLTEIMMAQDFHDLTGQVIARVVQLASTIEEQLLALLLQSAPCGVPGQDKVLELDGPVVAPEGRTDVVSDQAQVDDLLASLGF